jgi:tRNA(fMet)-specific endonuclease VapC
MLLLDSNIVIGLMDHRRHELRERYRTARRANHVFVLSSVVVFELCFGIANSQRSLENQEAFERFISVGYEFAMFDLQDAEIAGRIRARLKFLGTPIGPYDLLIAAQALRLDAILVTANTREFNRVPDLKLEDWTLPA